MSDYTVTLDGAGKDALTTGDPEKAILGSDIDIEFDAIAVAIATKYDAITDIATADETTAGRVELATTAEVVTGTDTARAVTPAGVEAWAAQNASIVQDLSNITDPGADVVFCWDEGTNAAKGFTLAEGLEFSGDTLTIADQAVSATVPVSLTAGALGFSMASITEITGVGLSQSGDGFLVSDAGVPKVMPYDDMGIKIKLAETTGTLDATDMNCVMEFNGTATLTIPANATTALPIGACVIIVVDHATQVVTVTADTGVTLNSIFHPAGGSAASDTVLSGGTAALIKTDTNDWYLTGNIAT